MDSNAKSAEQPRVKLTEGILRNFFENIFNGKVYELSACKGLPYNLAYNLARGRIHSLSAEDYRIIFGEEPPFQEPKRVDGEFFRGMVRLWLFLNRHVTEADLYSEFYQCKHFSKIDYRIFSGETKTIEKRLEKLMEAKFLDQGLDRVEIEKWIEELDQFNGDERIDYEEIKPVLRYLEKTLEVNPSRIINQWIVRYEKGELKTIPKKVYDHTLMLKRSAKEAIRSDSRFEIERLREEIYGKREGLTLYSEVEEELEFLQKYAGESPNKYLGRSISTYKKSKLKRIASWKAQKIKDDCNEFIRGKPKFPLFSVPSSVTKKKMRTLLSALKSYLIKKLIEDQNGRYEKAILTPSQYSKEEYETEEHGLTSMDKAGYALRMSRRAFDLLVAEHCDLFRRIGKYDEKWYLPNLYLKELLEREEFGLVIAKYEFLAKGQSKSPVCLSANKNADDPDEV